MKPILLILIATNLLFGTLSRDAEIVSDSATGLQWQDDAIVASTVRTWPDAIDYCENTLTLGGYSDWRLPNKKELLSIIGHLGYSPAVFVNTSLSSYWSSTTLVYFTDGAWYVINGGYSRNGHKTWDIYVRCVRGGQFETLPIPQITFVSENPQDDTIQRETFTKEWEFGSSLSGYSVEVVSSDYASYGSIVISNTNISMTLTPDTSKVVNTITLKLKDASNQYVTVSGSDTFWSRTKTNYAPRLADGQIIQLVSATNEPAFLEIIGT